MPALERLRPRHPPALLVAPAVPNDHATLADPALEVVVAHRVVFHLDREALDRRVERRPLRHGPRAHHPADLEAQVEVPAVAACCCTTNTPAGTPRIANCSWPSGADGSASDRRPSSLSNAGQRVHGRRASPSAWT